MCGLGRGEGLGGVVVGVCANCPEALKIFCARRTLLHPSLSSVSLKVVSTSFFFSPNSYLFVCVFEYVLHTQGLRDATVHMWKSENNLQELILSLSIL